MKADAIALAAAAVALIALLVAIWQGTETRQHNRMSVMPRIRFDLVRQGAKVQFSMVNTGTGPAVIEKFVLCRDAKPLISPNTNEFGEYFKGLDIPGTYFLWLPHSGDALTAGERPDIIQITLKKDDGTQDDDVQWNILKPQLQRFTVFCEYSSIYGEKRCAHADALGVPSYCDHC